jgi:hypothetical protein
VRRFSAPLQVAQYLCSTQRTNWGLALLENADMFPPAISAVVRV